MEDVLAIYLRPDDPPRPHVCLEETSTQLVADPGQPIPAAPGWPRRVDDAYERHGTANLLRMFEPWAGRRRGKVTERRTAVDLAHVRCDRVDGHDPQAEPMVRVMDHLNTPTPAAVYEAFAPIAARRILARLELHDPPKHGRWLNMADIDLSVLATPCVHRRIPNPAALIPEVTAWEPRRHTMNGRVDWRVTTPDASIKLTRLSPSSQL
jgi:DDE superfamily endonuclease